MKNRLQSDGQDEKRNQQNIVKNINSGKMILNMNAVLRSESVSNDPLDLV